VVLFGAASLTAQKNVTINATNIAAKRGANGQHLQRK
jgi:hypothetical protein